MVAGRLKALEARSAPNVAAWSYLPNSAGSHRFDNFSITILGGGQQRASKVLARRVRPQAALTPAPNQVFRLYYYATGTLYYLHSDHLGSVERDDERERRSVAAVQLLENKKIVVSRPRPNCYDLLGLSLVRRNGFEPSQSFDH